MNSRQRRRLRRSDPDVCSGRITVQRLQRAGSYSRLVKCTASYGALPFAKHTFLLSVDYSEIELRILAMTNRGSLCL